MPSARMIVANAAITLTIEAVARWRRAARGRIDLRSVSGRRSPSPHRRASDPDEDAADILRMDDDGGWQKAITANAHRWRRAIEDEKGCHDSRR
jgi:hypothetical protein